MAAVSNRKQDNMIAALVVAPAVITFLLIFAYPTLRMVAMSLTNAPLIGPGEWVGLDNYARQLASAQLQKALANTLYFIVLTVIPGTFLALFIAMGINRLSGRTQMLVLACFFLPSILPVSVVTQIWTWIANMQYGVIQNVIGLFTGGRPLPVLRSPTYFMPSVAVVTIWWTIGFNILLFLAALRSISPDVYEAAALDNANRWRVFSRITWPLIWPITALVLTLQLIAQFKIFAQPYLLGYFAHTPADAQSVVMSVIYDLAFKQNKGGEGAAVATILFVIILIASVLQYQFLRARGER
ncbi:sugar ABC transporter permease [Rhizobium sp. P40RR-XXII]|uniref:carbohydrate ABC transporter permease n=1 Tax=Rhizobium sp. P40RR-XXII TaxID=2726739 RepID=UPI001456DB1B|nr:sugar ABC transporter permease [Rhizobium sp. P40RR-XXII]NLS17795.1 sugar ABC transporter permease [Rhizobium sp. P40RR-XXII]